MTPSAKQHLRRYADVIALWIARYDTSEIAAQLDLPESTVANWIANFRDVTRAEVASA